MELPNLGIEISSVLPFCEPLPIDKHKLMMSLFFKIGLGPYNLS